jgi:hypothetical protein
MPDFQEVIMKLIMILLTSKILSEIGQVSSNLIRVYKKIDLKVRKDYLK